MLAIGGLGHLEISINILDKSNLPVPQKVFQERKDNPQSDRAEVGYNVVWRTTYTSDQLLKRSILGQIGMMLRGYCPKTAV